MPQTNNSKLLANNKLLANEPFDNKLLANNKLLTSEAKTKEFAKEFALQLDQSLATQETTVVALYGELGSGKTTLVRYLLRSLGIDGVIRSPSYGLVEVYERPPLAKNIAHIFHFDLYRVQNPEELLYLPISDYLIPKALLLFEWPDYGGNYLPQVDFTLELKFVLNNQRNLRIIEHKIKT